MSSRREGGSFFSHIYKIYTQNCSFITLAFHKTECFSFIPYKEQYKYLVCINDVTIILFDMQLSNTYENKIIEHYGVEILFKIT